MLAYQPPNKRARELSVVETDKPRAVIGYPKSRHPGEPPRASGPKNIIARRRESAARVAVCTHTHKRIHPGRASAGEISSISVGEYTSRSVGEHKRERDKIGPRDVSGRLRAESHTTALLECAERERERLSPALALASSVPSSADIAERSALVGQPVYAVTLGNLHECAATCRGGSGRNRTMNK